MYIFCPEIVDFPRCCSPQSKRGLVGARAWPMGKLPTGLASLLLLACEAPGLARLPHSPPAKGQTWWDSRVICQTPTPQIFLRLMKSWATRKVRHWFKAGHRKAMWTMAAACHATSGPCVWFQFLARSWFWLNRLAMKGHEYVQESYVENYRVYRWQRAVFHSYSFPMILWSMLRHVSSLHDSISMLWHSGDVKMVSWLETQDVEARAESLRPGVTWHWCDIYQMKFPTWNHYVFAIPATNAGYPRRMEIKVLGCLDVLVPWSWLEMNPILLNSTSRTHFLKSQIEVGGGVDRIDATKFFKFEDMIRWSA